MRRFFGWAGLAMLIPVAALWLLSQRWAVVWSTTNTVGRVYGGKVDFGGYERLRFEAQWPKARIVRRLLGDWYGGLCHEVRVVLPLWWAGAPSAALAALLMLGRPVRGSSRCRRCGYDLSGLGCEAVCPECGLTSEVELRKPLS